jgi:hypothetical protein
MVCLRRSPQWPLGQAGRADSRRGLWLAYALLMACLSAGSLHAQSAPDSAAPAPVQSALVASMVRVEAGASCLAQSRLVERIARWRQGAPLDASIQVYVRGDAASPTRVFFSVARAGAPPSERVIDNAPSDCDQLHSAVALSIALAIDAMLSGERGLPAVPNVSTGPPPTAARRMPLRVAHAAGLYAEVGLLAGASVGVVTNLAGAALPRVQLSPVPWFALALAGFGTRADRATIGDVPGSFSATVLAAGLDVCLGGESIERLSFFMCAGARAGQFITDSTGYRTPLHRASFWTAVAASGQARAWIAPAVGIAISVDALFALAARDLALVGATPGTPTMVRTIPQVGLSVAAGPVFRFF